LQVFTVPLVEKSQPSVAESDGVREDRLEDGRRIGTSLADGSKDAATRLLAFECRAQRASQPFDLSLQLRV
jgi:hypothetical protein